MSLHAIVTAHQEGYDENMYLDAATRTKVEETGGANFIFVTKDNKVVTPKSKQHPAIYHTSFSDVCCKKSISD